MKAPIVSAAVAGALILSACGSDSDAAPAETRAQEPLVAVGDAYVPIDEVDGDVRNEDIFVRVDGLMSSSLLSWNCQDGTTMWRTWDGYEINDEIVHADPTDDVFDWDVAVVETQCTLG